MGQNKKGTLILSSDDVQDIVQKKGIDQVMDVLIDDMYDAFLKFDPKVTHIPLRSGFNYEKPLPGLVEWMPVHRKNQEVVIKVVGYHPRNPETFNLPTILSTISSYDTQTGHLRGVVDGVLLTALRTGAASAIASRQMAHSESSIFGLIGCGAQAITQLHAISRVFPLQKVLYYDKDPNALTSLSERCSSLNINCDLVESSILEIVNSCDIISTATSVIPGEGPLFSNLRTKKWAHFNAVGSDFPGKLEIPLDIVENAFVCPDFLDQALIEGECQQLKRDLIGPELVAVVQNAEKYDYVKTQVSVFDSTGWALEDQVVMDLFIRFAEELNIGKEIAIENILLDAKNPYHFLLNPVLSGIE